MTFLPCSVSSRLMLALQLPRKRKNSLTHLVPISTAIKTVIGILHTCLHDAVTSDSGVRIACCLQNRLPQRLARVQGPIVAQVSSLNYSDSHYPKVQ